jgi:hypothetical protein
MKKLNSYFKNIFPKGDKIPDLTINKFFQEHVVAIDSRNTTGQYDTMYNATKTAAKDFLDAITDKDTKSARCQGQTKKVDILVKNFKKGLPRFERVVGLAFLPDGDTYQEFFPHGMKEYYKATKTNIDGLMLRLWKTASSHTSSLDAAFIDGLEQSYLQFKQARAEQLTAKENLSAATLTKRQARLRIELQVTRNVMTLAIEFLENPKAGLAFFDTSLLKLHQNKKKKKEAPAKTTTQP